MHPSTECQPTNQPSNNAAKPTNLLKCCRYLFCIAGRRCALPCPPPAFIYTPSIYASMHASIPTRQYLQSIHPSTHQKRKQPTNQATKATQPSVFPKCCRYFVCIAGEGAAPSPAPPPAFIYTASIHPSIDPSTKRTNRKNCISIKHCITQAINSKQTSQPTHQKVTCFSLSMIHPSLYVLSPNPSNQQTSLGKSLMLTRHVENP